MRTSRSGIALVALLCAAGCGGGGDDEASTPTATPSATPTATATAQGTPESASGGGSSLTHRQLVERLDGYCARYLPRMRDANRHVIRTVSNEREAAVPVKRAARLSAGFEAGVARFEPPERDAEAFERHLSAIQAQRKAIADFEKGIEGKADDAVAEEVSKLRRATRRASARRVKAARQIGAAKCAKRT